MKVLIISLPRCGSTSLMNKISEERNLLSYMEPFSMETENQPPYDFWNDKTNVIVKTLIGQPQLNDLIKFYTEFSKNFDEVILLSRKDLIAVSESYAYLKWNAENGFKMDDDYEWEETPNLAKTHQLITKLNDDINQLAKILNLKVTYYEELFNSNSSKRLRKNKRVKTLI